MSQVHVAEIERHPARKEYRAHCSCGHVGSYVRTAAEAKADHRHHAEDSKGTGAVSEEYVDITAAQACDWLVRSALPLFCDLTGLEEDAAWFRALPPYAGHTPSGRVKGWQGAGRRIQSVEAQLRRAFHDLIHREAAAGRPLHLHDLPEISPAMRKEVRGAAVFAREAMRPSGIGWDAYRVFSAISRFAAYAGHAYGVEDAHEALEKTWFDAWCTITDRGRLNAFGIDAEVSEAR